jgi:hypothetical protein
MKAAFKASLDRNNPTIMGDEWRMIGAHSAVAYILSPPIKKKESESISAMALLLVAELLNSGGVAAKSESAGLAHGRERWLDLALQYRKAIKDGDAHAASAALYRAWVQRAIHDEDTSSLYSVGMHLLGHRDVEVDDDLKVTDAVKWIDLMGLYLVADKPKRALRAGEGFRLCDTSPQRIRRWRQDRWHHSGPIMRPPRSSCSMARAIAPFSELVLPLRRVSGVAVLLAGSSRLLPVGRSLQ